MNGYVCCLCGSTLRPSVRTECTSMEAQLVDWTVHRMYTCGACVREIWRDEHKLEDIRNGSPESDNLRYNFWYTVKDEIWARIERRGVRLFALRYVKSSACV